MSRKQQFWGWCLLALLFLSFPYAAEAVYAPEPQSGGRFFEAKGTKDAREYVELGRTGIQTYDDYYYGDGLHAGIVEIRPLVSYTREFDSNVFLTESDRKHDWINRLNWGVEAEAPINDGQYIVYGGVESESEWFTHHDSQNHTDWVFQGGTKANFNYFSVEVFEDFRRTVNRGVELTSRIDRKENYLMGLLTVPMAQFFFEGEVSHYMLVFRDPDLNLFDREELRGIPRLGVNVGDRTQVLVEYAITNINYDDVEDRNGDSHAPSVGVRGFLGEGDLVSYQAWVGWEVRNYDSDARDDFSNVIFRGDLRYRPSELTDLIAEINRRPVESVSNNNSYITRNEVTARFRRQLHEYVFIDLRGTAGIYDYSNDRLDFFWEPAGRLEVVLPKDKVSIFSEYKFTQRESDAFMRDYYRHIVNFGVKVEI